MSRERSSAWLFSPRVDLASFVAPALFALGVAWLSPELWPEGESPEWLWVAGILLVDVAHVWSTAFLTYFDREELARNARRYVFVPVLGWVLSVSLYSSWGAPAFWRALAYLAVFHFVRQQYGWLMLYRARAGDRSRAGAFIDGLAIYAATLYPLAHWHAHLPRRFAWFMPGDFLAGLPRAVADVGAIVFWLALALYLARALLERARGQPTPWGKHLLLATTAATWYAGIIATNSDVAFTATNVLAHGIPYAVLVFSYSRHARQGPPLSFGRRVLSGGALGAAVRFALCLWGVAFLEELLWDRSVWHEHEALFGASSLATSAAFASFEALWVPLLALPQLTHYVLDGLFWRRVGNPALGAWIRRDN